MTKYLIFILSLAVVFSSARAQDKNAPYGYTADGKPATAAAPYTYVEQQPVAGYDINTYFRDSLRYPEKAREGKIEGRVIVQFVVNEDGSLSNIKVIRGIGAGCDEEAKRLIAAMPKWKPGQQGGKAVKVYFSMPVLFKLE